MRSIRAKRVLALVAASAALVAAAFSPAAGARPATAVVPNGTYGALNAARGEYVVFKVRNRKVRDLEFQIQITCQASDEPTSEQRFFTGGAAAPQGRVIPANGKLLLNWRERGNGRLGNVSVELKFGVRDIANFAVIVPEEPGPEAVPDEAKESCDGVGSLRVQRGFELPPVLPIP
ncbi:MAG: hypothetical protein ABW065_13210 [Solirubrobacterales bacterium]